MDRLAELREYAATRLSSQEDGTIEQWEFARDVAAYDSAIADLNQLAALQGASALEVPVVNDLVAWLDGPDGNGRADDAIIKFTDAKGAAIAHVNAEWMKVFLATTHGVDFSEGAAHKVPEYKSPSPSA